MSLKREDLLMQNLENYFDDNEKFLKVYNIIEGKSKVSLRIIDWCVTNFCKKHGTMYYINNELFIVHKDYKSQLKSYSKKQFDPFCRRDRIEFGTNGKEIITTVGQLNFFRWAIENNIIEYVEENYESIDNDMRDSAKSRKNSNYKPSRSNDRTVRHSSNVLVNIFF